MGNIKENIMSGQVLLGMNCKIFKARTHKELQKAKKLYVMHLMRFLCQI